MCLLVFQMQKEMQNELIKTHYAMISVDIAGHKYWLKFGLSENGRVETGIDGVFDESQRKNVKAFFADMENWRVVLKKNDKVEKGIFELGPADNLAYGLALYKNGKVFNIENEAFTQFDMYTIAVYRGEGAGAKQYIDYGWISDKTNDTIKREDQMPGVAARKLGILSGGKTYTCILLADSNDGLVKIVIPEGSAGDFENLRSEFEKSLNSAISVTKNSKAVGGQFRLDYIYPHDKKKGLVLCNEFSPGKYRPFSILYEAEPGDKLEIMMSYPFGDNRYATVRLIWEVTEKEIEGKIRLEEGNTYFKKRK